MHIFVLYSIAIYILYTFIKIGIRRAKYDIHKIPSPPSYPIIGHLHNFIGNERLKYPVWIYNWYQKLGQPPIMLVDKMFSKIIIINDTSFIHKKMFTHNGYEKAKAQYHSLLYFVDDKKPAHTIFTTTKINPTWKAIRKAVAMSFSTEGLKQKFPVILSCLDKFEDIVLNQNKPFESQICFSNLALDVIMLAGFEHKFDSYNQGSQLIRETSNAISNAIIKRTSYFIKVISYLFPKSSLAQKYRETMDFSRAIAEEILKSFKSREINEDNLSIIANLSRVIDPETGEKLSDFKIISEIVTLIFAGFLTTGSQLSWIFVTLSMYPECEDKILKELKEHNFTGNTNSEQIKYNDLSKLTYLNAFVKECLRMAPAIVVAGHQELPHDEIVCGYRLPKGTVLSVFNRTHHMTKSTWENPDAFIPERWLAENSSDLTKNLTTFSHGLRSCVGMQLAMTEILTAMIFLISKYKIKFVNDEKKSLQELMNETYTNGAMSHEKGLFFEYEKRNQF